MEIAETPAPSEDTPKLDLEEIRRRAYELSQQDPQASPMDNWLRAESELLVAIQMSVYTHP